MNCQPWNCPPCAITDMPPMDMLLVAAVHSFPVFILIALAYAAWTKWTEATRE